jgi:hypothetical protein
VESGSGRGEKWIMKPAREKGPERGGKKIVIGILRTDCEAWLSKGCRTAGQLAAGMGNLAPVSLVFFRVLHVEI